MPLEHIDLSYHQTYGHFDTVFRGNLLLPHRLLFYDRQQGIFYMSYPTDRIAHTTTFVIPVVEHWLEREIA